MTNLLSIIGAAIASIGISVGTASSGLLGKTDYTPSSLPTTIYLNDTSESDIRAYYSSLNSLEEEERKGNNLLKNLKEIIKKDQKYYQYDGSSQGKKIWQLYEIVDRDWTKSPASEISGYDAATNTITGYQYGTSETDAKTNPYLHALYVDRTVDNNMRAWAKTGTTTSSHGDNKEWNIDREHIWAKSQGFENTGKGGARGDPMHLWPGDSDVNSSLHNDQMYGYVDIKEGTKKGKWSYGQKNYIGTSLTLGTSLSTEDVFEPQDSDKGDIARAIFYMVARYNYLSGSDADGIDSNNPNLELAQTNEVLSGYASTTTITGKMGVMTDLLAWHHADPVDEFEIHRNNLLYTNYTNNRNPFIDFPDWVDYIWGTVEYNGRTFVSHTPTPAGFANPASDPISRTGGGGGGGSSSEPGSSEADNPSGKKGLDTKTIIIIAAVAGGVIVVAAVLIVIFVNSSKRGKKKMLKTGKKIIKKTTKDSKNKK